MDTTTIARRMAAIGNESRLEIYRLLVRAGDRGLPVTKVQERLEIPGSTLSHHLHKLIEVGLVVQERQGRTLICRSDFNVLQDTFELFARECCAEEECRNGEACCGPAPTEMAKN